MGASNVHRVRRPLRRAGYTSLMAVAALWAVLAAGCSRNKEMKIVEMGQTTFPFDRDNAPFDIFAEYRIKPGDLLDVLYQIATWREQESYKLAVDDVIQVKFLNSPELDTQQSIRPDGTVSLPYLGQIHVTDKSVTELNRDLTDRYGKLLRSPEVLVLVPEYGKTVRELKQDLHTAPRGLSRLVFERIAKGYRQLLLFDYPEQGSRRLEVRNS